MSTPPKPKVGSLRDRIAAFEKPASTTPPGPPPSVRPKPAGFATWKPKVPTPPSSPAAATTEHASPSARAGGMSASDAKESITKAGSLKDRMAALQGKGAFGAPPSVAPKPAVDKPRWKPPPVVHAPVDDSDHPAGESTANIAAAVERTISPPVAVKPQENIVRAEGEGTPSSPPAAGSGEGEGDDTAESGPADPEEEERQRRAAIAARMARLGGARLGMAPPVFGKKPPVRRPTQEEAPKAEELKPEEETKRDISSPEAIKPVDVPLPAPSDENLLISPPLSTTPAVAETQSDPRTSPEYFPKRKNSESTSILSSESTESHPARSPASMPVPAVPRRAGPPRKKPSKPAAPPPEVPEEETPVTGVAGVEEEVSPPTVDEPKGEPAVESFETPRDDLLAEVQALKAEIQQEIEIPSADQSLAVPEPSLSPPPIAEETTPIPSSPVITPPRRDSILIAEPSGIRSPPPTPLAAAEEKEGEQFELEDEEDFGADDNSDIAEALATPPIPVLLSPSRETPAAVAKHEKEPTPVSPPTTASEEDITDEAEEEERKKRVAERLAKMGGINPFAMSPPLQAKPQPETSRSPPQVPVSFVPSSPSVPSAAPSMGSVIRSPSPEPTRKDSTTESNAEEEEEAFDEDDDEGEVFENQPGPITNKHYEKPKDSRAEPLERPHIPARPPVPPPATRPPVQVQQIEADDDSGSDYSEDDIANTPAPSIPVNPPAKLTSPTKPPSPPARPAQPPRRIVPQTPGPQTPENEEEDEDEEDDTDEEADERLAQSQLFVPPPTRRVPGAIPPNRRYLQDEEDGNGSESDSPALPILHRKSLEVPAGRPTHPHASDGHESWDPESDHDGQALPIPPRRTSVPPPPRVVPPPPPPALHHPPPVHRSPPPSAPAAVAHLLAVSPLHVPRTTSGSSEEVLGEEEGDPIDPGFHSPSRRGSTINLAAQTHSEAPAPVQSSPSPPAPPPATTSYRAPAEQEQTGEDAKHVDRLGRNTIADRMAKLGGIKFGAAPLPTPASHPSTPQPSNEEEGQAEDATGTEQPTEPSEEEEERARKERIAAKMASMGGMRIGMMPMGMGGFPPQRSHVLKEEPVASPPSLPPSARAVPPPQPPPRAQSSQVPDSDSDYGSAAASEDGVKVEAEESSELEEVNYEDAEETKEEPPPPPVPSRAVRPTRRQSSMDQPTSPAIPPSRPPVPTSVPTRRSSVQTTRSIGSIDNTYGTPPQRSSGFMPPSQSEYVMVEEPESQEIPPQPPIRSSRLPPMRSTPQVPQAPTMQSSEATSESISSQWELPSIPTSTFDFGGGADLSLSWTDAGEATTSSQPSAPAPPSKRATLPAERQLSADDLIALWGRVGVQVCEIATSMFEKSKKTLIGDGTYTGFVQAVVATVPNAAPVPTASGEYGYVVYVQNGAAVQKRASEIMPGDIVEIHDAKFKGHKGLQTYHQNVGAAGEDLVGVVGEFEAKKSKIRVFHANQHVGQQTVESVSYRLEDLKSGIVKVYRVLEA